MGSVVFYRPFCKWLCPLVAFYALLNKVSPVSYTHLVRTLLEMSNLQSVARTDQIALAPLVEEILTDLTPLAQKNNISWQQDCEELGMVGSDALIYRLGRCV